MTATEHPKILFVGGTFDDNGGKPSSVVAKFFSEMCVVNREGDSYSFPLESDENAAGKSGCTKTGAVVDCYNGGNYTAIQSLLNAAAEYDCVIWWANVPNDKPKLRNIKEINPRAMLVTSKRNDGEKYTFQELINHALGLKANLSVEFSKNENGQFNFRLFDPLGNSWYNGVDIASCCDVMLDRLHYLSGITRTKSCHIDDEPVPEVPDKPEFFAIIKEYAETLHELIMPADGVTRFLGNTSFRCMRGFPSFKDNGLVFVSQRNVDKRYIGKEAFVPTLLVGNTVCYYGDHKPSVDTPIQLRLYAALPSINYMFHSHVYIEDAPFTDHMVPCGGLEEVDEVLGTVLEQYGTFDDTLYAINLIGHGSIVMCNDVSQLKDLKFKRRPIPEEHNEK